MLCSRRLLLLGLILPALVVIGVIHAADPVSAVVLPTEQTAVTDVQQFLNLRTGLWTVNAVTKSAERQTYEMEVNLNITVQTSGSPRKEDLENDPWLALFAGKAGERKVIPVTLTWVKTSHGWKLRTITPRAG